MPGQVWATNTLGGFMYSNQLTDDLRCAVQPATKFRQFCDVKEAFGKHKGQTFTWDVYSDAATKGAQLTETNTMPETNFTITQGTLTVNEYGNSVPYTGILDDLSYHDVKQVVHKVMKNDCVKALDVAAFDAFNATDLRIVPTSGTDTAAITLTTDGTATATNAIALGKEHVKNIVDTMKERNIPAYVNDDYYCLAHPTTFRTFKDDLETINQYTDVGFQKILNGEIGRYESMRYCEQTHIPKGGAADSTAFNPLTDTADAWDNGNSSWAFFFGDDTVVEGITNPEEVRGKIPTDYGRSKGIAWYYLGGYGLVHTDAAQERIFKWDSAS